MKKIALLLTIVFFSVNLHALTTEDLKTAILDGLKTNYPVNGSNKKIAFIYGGKDLSHQKIVVAAEHIWTPHHTFIG